MLSQLTAANPQEPLPTPQVVMALTLAIVALVVVIELVRRQKLREEYAILWIGTAIVLVVLAAFDSVLEWLAELTEAQSLTSILFFGGIVFLMVVALMSSIRLTKLTFRNKTLSQRIALLEQQVEELRKRDSQDVLLPRHEASSTERSPDDATNEATNETTRREVSDPIAGSSQDATR